MPNMALLSIILTVDDMAQDARASFQTTELPQDLIACLGRCALQRQGWQLIEPASRVLCLQSLRPIFEPKKTPGLA